MNLKSKYLSSACWLLLSSVVVKIIGAVYKIPLTGFIGAVGRGYFAAAYQLYLPFHAVLMGAMPIALSRLVSKYRAQDNTAMLGALQKSAVRLFLAVGFGGTALILAAAKPYASFIASSPKSIYTIAVLAPSLLFSCLAAAYRGYYEGWMNMQPTAVSQTLEALVKLVFGLLFAKISMAYCYQMYTQSGSLFGNLITNEQEALSRIYPITSAAAMLGVTFGSLVSLLYVWLYHQINGKRHDTNKTMTRRAQNELWQFSLPMMISCAVQSVFQFLDTASVQLSLRHAEVAALKQYYAESIALAGAADKDLVTYLYGLLSTATDFKNLIPGITMALGVCAVPAISAACEGRQRERLSASVNTVFKYTMLLSSAGGILLAGCAKEVLAFFYAASSPDIVVGCEQLVKAFALTVPFYALAGTAVFCVQAIGYPEKSIAPYIVSGIIRVVLNILLIDNSRWFLTGSVVAGAAGYAVMFLWNLVLLKKLQGVGVQWFDAFLKPLFISLLSYFCLIFLSFYLNFAENALFNLLIKAAVFAPIYCILCFLFKALNFTAIFSVINFKKNGLNT